MDLFQPDSNFSNIIPFQGKADYYGCIIGHDQANSYFKALQTQIDWQHEEITLFGKSIRMQRRVAWYGDHAFPYTYSNTTKIAKDWTPLLLKLKILVEKTCNESFNSCLLNYYENGKQGMSWHCDQEKEIQQDTAIASLSLGATRDFLFKHKTQSTRICQSLEHGSLLVMRQEIQQHWLHSLPKRSKIHCARINLTFRTMVK